MFTFQFCIKGNLILISIIYSIADGVNILTVGHSDDPPWHEEGQDLDRLLQGIDREAFDEHNVKDK